MPAVIEPSARSQRHGSGRPGCVGARGGGAQGIGLAVAQLLAGAGTRLAIWDINAALAKTAAATLDGQAFAVDVADTKAVARANAATEAALGPAAILVTSAGITGSNGPVVGYEPAEWRQIMDINLTGTFNCCRSILPQMRALIRTRGQPQSVAELAAAL